MKTFVISLLLVIASVVVLMMIPSKQTAAPMPWDVSIMPDGNSKVFGIHLGTTTYRQAQEVFHQYAKTAVFTQEGKIPTVVSFPDLV